MIQFCVCEFLEAVTQNDHAAVFGNLQIQFNVAMAEDIIIAMVVLLFLFFGKKHQLFLVFALVGARLRDLF